MTIRELVETLKLLGEETEVRIEYSGAEFDIGEIAVRLDYVLLEPDYLIGARYNAGLASSRERENNSQKIPALDGDTLWRRVNEIQEEHHN